MFPVVPRNILFFRVSCPNHIPEMPLTSDFSQAFIGDPRVKNIGSPISKFNAKDLEPDWDHFEELVWPALAKKFLFLSNLN